MKTKEIWHILLAIIVSAFVVSFTKLSPLNFAWATALFAVIFIFSIGTKKIIANHFQSDIETNVWHFQRWGWYERSHFKHPFPVGIILPFLLIILTLGYIPWLATTQIEIIASRARVAKRHGIYRYSEMTDWETGWIAASGIIVCFILAIAAYLIGIADLSKYAILFAFFNLLPLGNLDGTKILFGNKVLWAVLGVISMIGLGYVIWLV